MNPEQPSRVLSNTATIGFAQFGGRTIQGKVDTGATTSSLNATRISIDQSRGAVTFMSAALSDNMITLDLDGSQEVHSADGGGATRPIVKLDVTVDGVSVEGAQFNLNDREGMESDLLIGQNILQAGQFTIDPNKQEAKPTDSADPAVRESAILAAVEALVEQDVSFSELVQYMRTAAINRIKD